MYALKAELEDAEKAKEEVKNRLMIDPEKQIMKEGGYIYFPILKEYRTDFEIVEKELPLKEKPLTFKEALKDKVPQEKLWHLKTSQDVIGDIAIIEVPEELEEYEKVLGETLLEVKPYVKTALKKGKHEGEYRTQELKLLAGEDKKVTTHKENGVDLKLDVEKIYFSPRLSTERERIASMTEKGERILVLFSGCAPYPCVIARNSEPSEVIGVEINPKGHAYGVENVEKNNLENVYLYEGDVAEIVPQLEEGFDRIVMPAPHNATQYLKLALSKIKDGGTIHLYDFCKEEKFQEFQEQVREEALKHGYKARILKLEKCGQVSPHEYRVCIDFKAQRI